jgi:hypothetical protein
MAIAGSSSLACCFREEGKKDKEKEKGLAGLRKKKWDARKIFNGLGRALDWAEWVGKQ